MTSALNNENNDNQLEYALKSTRHWLSARARTFCLHHMQLGLILHEQTAQLRGALHLHHEIAAQKCFFAAHGAAFAAGQLCVNRRINTRAYLLMACAQLSLDSAHGSGRTATCAVGVVTGASCNSRAVGAGTAWHIHPHSAAHCKQVNLIEVTQQSTPKCCRYLNGCHWAR